MPAAAPAPAAAIAVSAVGGLVEIWPSLAPSLAAQTKAKAPASAVNQTIFFLSTVNSSIRQRIGHVRLASKNCQFALLLAPGRFSTRCSISLFALFPFSCLACYLRRRRRNSFMSVNKVTIREGSPSRGAARRGISLHSGHSSEGEAFYVRQ